MLVWEGGEALSVDWDGVCGASLLFFLDWMLVCGGLGGRANGAYWGRWLLLMQALALENSV